MELRLRQSNVAVEFARRKFGGGTGVKRHDDLAVARVAFSVGHGAEIHATLL